MNPTLCRCCGGSMSKAEDASRGNPNICVTCALLEDETGRDREPRGVVPQPNTRMLFGPPDPREARLWTQAANRWQQAA